MNTSYGIVDYLKGIERDGDTVTLKYDGVCLFDIEWCTMNEEFSVAYFEPNEGGEYVLKDEWFPVKNTEVIEAIECQLAHLNETRAADDQLKLEFDPVFNWADIPYYDKDMGVYGNIVDTDIYVAARIEIHNKSFWHAEVRGEDKEKQSDEDFRQITICRAIPFEDDPSAALEKAKEWCTRKALYEFIDDDEY